MSDKPRGDAPPPTTEEQPSFVQRWSWRKRGAEQPPAPAAEPAPPAPPDETATRELTDADMPPLESLDENADYSGFFSPKVSAELRRVALRKLFHAPRFNITDGLDDYAEDFTAYQALGEVVTHEMKRMLEREAKRLAAQSTDTDDANPDTPDGPPLTATEPSPPPQPDTDDETPT